MGMEGERIIPHQSHDSIHALKGQGQVSIMSVDEREQHKDDCVRQALVEGAKSSAWALATSSLLVGLANQYLPAFRTSLGVSGKTALIVCCFSAQNVLGAVQHQGLCVLD